MPNIGKSIGRNNNTFSKEQLKMDLRKDIVSKKTLRKRSTSSPRALLSLHVVQFSIILWFCASHLSVCPQVHSLPFPGSALWDWLQIPFPRLPYNWLELHWVDGKLGGKLKGGRKGEARSKSVSLSASSALSVYRTRCGFSFCYTPFICVSIPSSWVV